MAPIFLELKMYQLIDFVSKQEVTTNNLVFSAEDTPWEVVMDLEHIRGKLNLDYFKIAPPCLSKYLPFMPIKENSQFVSLREGATPLIKSKNIGAQLGIELYFKVEGKNPTGSFKDRGSAVDISVAKEMGAKGIVVASTGNMAASCACYAAAAKIPCFVFVPEGVSVSKLAQVISFGGHIVQVKGTYNDAADLAYKVAIDQDFYLAGDYAFRVEGQKTAAFEMLDQLFFQTPDAVVVPIGCGTNITAYAKGFNEYLGLGLIDSIPKLIGVQSEGAKAVVNSYTDQVNTIQGLPSIDTLATAIAVPNPIDGVKALDAIYSTSGSAIAVSDNEILQAQYLLSTEEGLFVESASAATLASLLKMQANGEELPRKVVCVLTGEGLKDPSVILKSGIKPPTIYPQIDEFGKLYDSGFFNNKTMLFDDQNKVLFQNEPSRDEIKVQLNKLFKGDYADTYLHKIEKIIGGFYKKGKSVTIADFQDIVQDAQETLPNKVNESFVVKDFNVTTGKDQKPQANVKVLIDGDELAGNSDGVGPVDAVINALCKACHGKISFELTDYKVEIRSQGVNAVVYTELTLIKDHLKSVGSATSPDLIQASIEAFEEAYNGFC